MLEVLLFVVCAAWASPLYKEDVLYMLRKDVKTIKMMDFFPNSVLSSFYYADPEAGGSVPDGIVPPPTGIRVSQVSYTLFDSNLLNDTGAVKGADHSLELMENTFSFKSTAGFRLYHIISADQEASSYLATQKGEKSLQGYLPLHQTNDENSLVYFFRQQAAPYSLQVDLYFLNMSNPESVLSFQATARFASGGLEYQDYRIVKHYQSARNLSFLGYRPSFLNNQQPLFECTFSSSSQQAAETAAVEGACVKLGHTFSNTSNNEVVLVDYHRVKQTGAVNTSSIDVVLRNRQIRFKYYMMRCDRSLDQFVCRPPVDVEVNLSADLPHIPIDLGDGQIAFGFESFIIYPTGINQDYKKLYMTLDRSLFEPDSRLYISSSVRKSVYLLIGVSKTGSKRVDHYLIVGMSSNPADVLRKTVDSDYFGLQGNTLFAANVSQSASSMVVSSFTDPFVQIRGEAVLNKTGGQPLDTATQELRFEIVTKVQDVVSQRKLFRVVLVNKPLAVLNLSIPYERLKLIRGGTISVTLHEDHIAGNDLEVAAQSSVDNLRITAQGNSIYKLDYSNITQQEPRIRFQKMILLWDNYMLVSSKSTGTLYVCFLEIVASNATRCDLRVSIASSAGATVQHAYLLNFQTMIVHFAYSPESVGAAPLRAKNSLQIFNISRMRRGSSLPKNISREFFFEPEPGEQQVVLYSFQGSAVCYYNGRYAEGKAADLPGLFAIKAVPASSEDSFVFSSELIKLDPGIYKAVNSIIPDFSTKNYFYLSATDPNNVKTTYYVAVSPKPKSPKESELTIFRRLTNRFIAEGSNQYCGEMFELLIFQKAKAAADSDSFLSFPFSTNDAIYEKMVRYMPLAELGYDRVLAYDCLAERNSLVAVVTGTNSKNPATFNKPVLINYNFDSVHDPRKRIETIIAIPGLQSQGVMLSANSWGYKNKDFAVISFLDGEGQAAPTVYYVDQLVKIIKFEAFCPMHVPPTLDIVLKFFIGASPSTSLQQVLKVDVRPLEYQTQIIINNDAKLSKATKVYNLEENLLTIKGHYFTARLVQRSTKTELPANHSVSLIRRKKELSKLRIRGGVVTAHGVWEFTFVLTANGNVNIYRNNTLLGWTKKQSNFMEAGELPERVLPNHMYLILGETRLNEVLFTYVQVARDANRSLSVIMKQVFSQSIKGTFRRVNDALCGKNLYLLLSAKNGASIKLARFDILTKEKAAEITISIESPIVNADAICLQDSNDLDESLAVILLFQNQTQTVYKFHNQSEATQLTSLELSFREKDAYLNDFECELSGSPQPLPASSSYLTKFKCFYSTRWADDYVVYYGIESGPTVFRVLESKMVQKVPEVNHFNPLQTKAYKNWVVVFGENLQEPPLTRSFYALMYAFDLDSTHIVTYIKVPKSIDVDGRQIANLYSICNDGTFIQLFSSERQTNTYDQVIRFRLGALELNVSNTDFSPSDIDLELTTIGGEFLQKINLGGLFDLRDETSGLTSRVLSSVMLLVLLAAVLGLAASLLYWLVVQRIYSKTKDRFLASLEASFSAEQALHIERQIQTVFEQAPQDLLEFKKGKRSLITEDEYPLVELH